MFSRLQYFPLNSRRLIFKPGRTLILLACLLLSAAPVSSQDTLSTPVLTDSLTLDGCLSYAMKNHPLVKQLKLDEQITRQDIRLAYSDWLPQVTSSADYQRYLKQPVIFLPNFTDPTQPSREIQTGVKNNSTIAFSASQVLFNSDVYLAARTAEYYRKQTDENRQEVLIGLKVSISKAYYAVLSSQQQVEIIKEDIQRLNLSLRDAYARYQSGASDDIDYKRATIALNNAKTQLMSAGEALNARMAGLKQLMGYPAREAMNLASDYKSMESEIMIQPVKDLHYTDRIEFRLLKTNLQLQKAMVDYYRYGFLPSLSGYANYNFTYHNDNFPDLYKRSFPNSSVGLTLSLPIFEGARRLENLKKARLKYERLSLDTLNLRNQVDTEIIQAIASYRSYMTAYRSTSDNEKIAEEVYNTVKSQYNQGIKTYLEVIVSEADLRTAQINNINALFMVLSSKLDVEKALGRIEVNY